MLRRRKASFEGVVSRAENCSSVETENITRIDSLHLEWQTQSVAFGQEIGERVNVSGDVVR